jgi:hypothetical protein
MVKGNLYFAYGSNMDPDQMAFRSLEVLEAWGAVLYDHKLVFDFPARSRWLGGAADVVEAPGSRVEGVLYSLGSDVGTMDDWERGYRRVAVDVTIASSGRTLTAWTYVVIEKGPSMTPSEVYVAQMLRGGRMFGSSEAYMDELEGHMERGREELGDHVRAVRSLATAEKPMSLEELAASVDRPVDRVESVLSDLGRWGWVQANNEPPVFRIVDGKEIRSPWVLR